MIQGFSKDQYKQFKNILSHFPEIEELTLFGSRAMGNYKDASDVDILIDGTNVDLDTTLKLKSKLEDSTLPYMFDILYPSSINSDALWEHINKHGIHLDIRIPS